MARYLFTPFHQEGDSPDILPYVIKPCVGKKGESLVSAERTYPIYVPQEERCWKCKTRGSFSIEIPSMHRCSVCRNVYYCSKGCQRADWGRHKKVCRKSSFYDMTKCAIILNAQNFYTEEGRSCALRTVRKIVDEEHIHPNHILTDPSEDRGNNLSSCFGYINSNFPELVSLLERGLSAQEVIHNEDFLFNVKVVNIQLLLEYGGRNLYFPQQHELQMLRFLVDKGCDPEEIYRCKYIPNDNVALYLASVGCTFSQLDESGVPFLTVLHHWSYIDEVKRIMQQRAELLKTELSEHLLPVLANIVLRYARVGK